MTSFLPTFTTSPSQEARLASLCFALAVLHTFLAPRCHALSRRWPPASLGHGIWAFLGEIEVVFGVWATLFVMATALFVSEATAVATLSSAGFTEAAFVFVIMTVASTRPIMTAAAALLNIPSRSLPQRASHVRYVTLLIAGPLLGSLFTEPAAMTITALLLRDAFFSQPRATPRFKYASLGLLFVNISLGGTLSPTAAPPIIMVAAKWQWDVAYMLTHFAGKALIAISVGTLATTYFFRHDIRELDAAAPSSRDSTQCQTPWWVILVHLAFMAGIVAHHDRMAFFLPLFVVFLGWSKASQRHQSPLLLRESLLVGIFLGGLVVLGQYQGWWLAPLLARVQDLPLFLGATALTAFTDNATLTYLGSLVPSLSESGRYYLVAGAMTGGGLTVIANAPNPVGLRILQGSFGPQGVKASRLFLAALPYTLLAASCFVFY